jgi:hypothetical protein
MAATPPPPPTSQLLGILHADPANGERAVHVPPLQRRRPTKAAPQTAYRVLAAACILITLVLLTWGASQGKPLAIGVVAVPVVMALAYPVLARYCREERTFDLLGIVYLGLALRFVGSYYRFTIAADAKSYYRYGVQFADSFRNLDFVVDLGRPVPGTGTVRWFSALVVVFTGPNIYLEFVVFTLIAFSGMLLFYRAFTTAFPNGDRKRYALLLFLWPSMVFWPSSIGKESLMMFGIGLASYGASRMFTHRPLGMAALAGGLAVLALIRPHMSLIVIVGVGVAYLFVRSTRGSLWLSGGKILAIAVLLIGGAIIATQTAEFLKLDDFGQDQLDVIAQSTSDRTAQGGAEFTPIRADSSPVLFPAAVASVLFRPLPFEAHNQDSLIAAAEGLLLVAITAASWRRLARLPGRIIREPYVAYAVSMVLLFCFVFSVIANFGILTRQRTQVLPLYFVLLAIPAAREVASTAREPRQRRTLLTDPPRAT